ncbi:hypothetical protein K1X76_11570 [bacterium]|nr:hypothetical protein [bacterium]
MGNQPLRACAATTEQTQTTPSIPADLADFASNILKLNDTNSDGIYTQDENTKVNPDTFRTLSNVAWDNDNNGINADDLKILKARYDAQAPLHGTLFDDNKLKGLGLLAQMDGIKSYWDSSWTEEYPGTANGPYLEDGKRVYGIAESAIAYIAGPGASISDYLRNNLPELNPNKDYVKIGPKVLATLQERVYSQMLAGAQVAAN